MDNIYYYNKYLKYKNKYLKTGGHTYHHYLPPKLETCTQDITEILMLVESDNNAKSIVNKYNNKNKDAINKILYNWRDCIINSYRRNEVQLRSQEQSFIEQEHADIIKINNLIKKFENEVKTIRAEYKDVLSEVIEYNDRIKTGKEYVDGLTEKNVDELKRIHQQRPNEAPRAIRLMTEKALPEMRIEINEKKAMWIEKLEELHKKYPGLYPRDKSWIEKIKGFDSIIDKIQKMYDEKFPINDRPQFDKLELDKVLPTKAVDTTRVIESDVESVVESVVESSEIEAGATHNVINSKIEVDNTHDVKSSKTKQTKNTNQSKNTKQTKNTNQPIYTKKYQDAYDYQIKNVTAFNDMRDKFREDLLKIASISDLNYDSKVDNIKKNVEKLINDNTTSEERANETKLISMVIFNYESTFRRMLNDRRDQLKILERQKKHSENRKHTYITTQTEAATNAINTLKDLLYSTTTLPLNISRVSLNIKDNIKKIFNNIKYQEDNMQLKNKFINEVDKIIKAYTNRVVESPKADDNRVVESPKIVADDNRVVESSQMRMRIIKPKTNTDNPIEQRDNLNKRLEHADSNRTAIQNANKTRRQVADEVRNQIRIFTTKLSKMTNTNDSAYKTLIDDITDYINVNIDRYTNLDLNNRLHSQVTELIRRDLLTKNKNTTNRTTPQDASKRDANEIKLDTTQPNDDILGKLVKQYLDNISIEEQQNSLDIIISKIHLIYINQDESKILNPHINSTTTIYNLTCDMLNNHELIIPILNKMHTNLTKQYEIHLFNYTYLQNIEKIKQNKKFNYFITMLQICCNKYMFNMNYSRFNLNLNNIQYINNYIKYLITYILNNNPIPKFVINNDNITIDIDKITHELHYEIVYLLFNGIVMKRTNNEEIIVSNEINITLLDTICGILHTGWISFMLDSIIINPEIKIDYINTTDTNTNDLYNFITSNCNKTNNQNYNMELHLKNVSSEPILTMTTTLHRILSEEFLPYNELINATTIHINDFNYTPRKYIYDAFALVIYMNRHPIRQFIDRLRSESI